ncbi:DUF1385 domain-containing protein [Parasporobacterium paucivorans]|uniref:Uncharacterized conserved protein YqhQ n=1 Tax=Parasporobacterium paucivorans DSM 15970 TaxID=1122934 RepID=A0A1M6KER4_9FIRM|nr:DUF1385 domain-containing protein [Parasporobacterium paucivorans]SHJ57408.1 Uncharacterized conserved protein YqhQ [Parasporobacterium paucivorans DSM 15970]
MKSSGIGGQAVLEGIMMRNADKCAVAIRKPNQEIELKEMDCHGIFSNHKVLRTPFIRGAFNFIDSMVLGIKTLTYSATFFEEEAEEIKEKLGDKVTNKIFKEKAESVLIGFTVFVSIVIAVAVFMLLPFLLVDIINNFFNVTSPTLFAIIEGIIRVGIFIAYILLISKMKDIQRTFMYHGAEHKCINCIENGLPLTVENVMKSSKVHKRCGTSFLFIVMIISIIFFVFIRVDNTILKLVIRLLLIPVIAGVSYEFLKLAGRKDNRLVNVLSKPGLWMQKLTTSEPDESMAEVAIEAVEAVFDWEKFQKEETEAECRL